MSWKLGLSSGTTSFPNGKLISSFPFRVLQKMPSKSS